MRTATFDSCSRSLVRPRLPHDCRIGWSVCDPTTDIARLSDLRCGKCFGAGVRHLILWHPRRSGASREAA